jgi:hypothetical protein
MLHQLGPEMEIGSGCRFGHGRRLAVAAAPENPGPERFGPNPAHRGPLRMRTARQTLEDLMHRSFPMTRLSRFAAALLAGLTAATALAADTPSVSLTRLDCGTIEVRKLNLFSDTMAYPGREMTLTNSCYLIRHGEDLMLWDAGLPAALIGAPASPDLLAPSLTVDLPAQLAEIGVAPDRIGKLGLSHIHFDHTGQAAAFPQAELLIGAADWAVVSGGPLPPALQGFVMPDTLGPRISGGPGCRRS